MLSAPQHLQGQPVVDYRNRSSAIGERHHRLTSRVGLSEQAVRLTRIYCESCSRNWEHDVRVERAHALAVDEPRLLCLAGANACPPEDVGGPHGYTEFLRAIRDPKHKEHKDHLAWIGGVFDPKGFDLQTVNQRLRRLKV
jgi:Plasmid pRiA4b ORF-3-like protein